MPGKKDESVDIIRLEQGHVGARIIGTTPIILHRMSEKSRQEILIPGEAKSRSVKAATLKHDVIAEFQAAPYILRDGPTLVGHLSTAFKGAMSNAALDIPGATKSQIGRLVYVEGEYVGIFGKPELYMATVRQSGMNAAPDIRTRVIIRDWACVVNIKFISSLVKSQSVMNLLATAGIISGVGDWRPNKGKGNFGQFDLVGEDHEEFNRIVETYGRQAQLEALADPTPYNTETEELFAHWKAEVARRGFKVLDPKAILNLEGVVIGDNGNSRRSNAVSMLV